MSTDNHRQERTYVATSTAFTPGATPQDIFTISGSATSNVYVLKMGLTTTQTTAGTNAFFLAKRSTLNTGGVSAAPAIVQYDINNFLPTATVLQYTTTPGTNGALEGYAWGGWVNAPAIATAGIGIDFMETNFADSFAGPMALLTPTETIGWNFKGAALPPGLSVIAYVVWYESSKT